MIVEDGDELFLKHYGTKGMKWGVRKAAKQKTRAQNRAARSKRLKDGTATKMDKFIRNADLDRSWKQRASRNKERAPSKKEVAGQLAASAFLLAFGAMQINSVRKEVRRGGW
jgi:hypothetical protein